MADIIDSCTITNGIDLTGGCTLPTVDLVTGHILEAYVLIQLGSCVTDE